MFRAYLLTTLADGIGFWTAAILLSTGFGALHYFLKRTLGRLRIKQIGDNPEA